MAKKEPILSQDNIREIFKASPKELVNMLLSSIHSISYLKDELKGDMHIKELRQELKEAQSGYKGDIKIQEERVVQIREALAPYKDKITLEVNQVATPKVKAGALPVEDTAKKTFVAGDAVNGMIEESFLEEGLDTPQPDRKDTIAELAQDLDDLDSDDDFSEEVVEREAKTKAKAEVDDLEDLDFFDEDTKDSDESILSFESAGIKVEEM